MADENMLNAGANQGQKKDNVKYKVTVTCWWNEVLYRVDDEVELPASLTPPKEYFKKL